MSSGKADGQAAFDFLSNISFGAQDAPLRSSKKLKSSQPRSLTASKQGNASKGVKGSTNEPSDARKGNSRSGAAVVQETSSKPSNAASKSSNEITSTPSKSKSAHLPKHGLSEHRDHRYVLQHPLFFAVTGMISCDLVFV